MRRSRLHVPSFVAGAAVAALILAMGVGTASALDLGGLATAVPKAIASLVDLKKDLDADVKNLTGDAKTLLGDKDNLMKIKDQLIKLSKDTKSQIDGIEKLVGVVEGHLKTTNANIVQTSKHVGEIDGVKKTLGK